MGPTVIERLGPTGGRAGCLFLGLEGAQRSQEVKQFWNAILTLKSDLRTESSVVAQKVANTQTLNLESSRAPSQSRVANLYHLGWLKLYLAKERLD